MANNSRYHRDPCQHTRQNTQGASGTQTTDSTSACACQSWGKMRAASEDGAAIPKLTSSASNAKQEKEIESSEAAAPKRKAKESFFPEGCEGVHKRPQKRSRAIHAERSCLALPRVALSAAIQSRSKFYGGRVALSKRRQGLLPDLVLVRFFCRFSVYLIPVNSAAEGGTRIRRWCHTY